MRGTLHRLGVFPRSIECLFIEPKLPGIDFHYLVASKSREENWIRRFLPPKQILTYTPINTDKYTSLFSTCDIFTQTNLASVCQKAEIQSILMPGKSNDTIYQWARHHQIDLLSTNYQTQKQFENKIWFDNFLDAHHLPKPQSWVVSGSTSKLPPGKLVIQDADSCGSEGTYFISSIEELDKLRMQSIIQPEQTYLLREYVSGKPYGISVFITPDVVALSAIRLQCYTRDVISQQRFFSGVQWISTNNFSQNVIENLNKLFMELGRLLKRQHFFGFANFDFMIDDQDHIFLIECNPRLSAATTQIIALKQLISNLDTGGLFLQGLCQTSIESSQYRQYLIPNSEFQGSMAEVMIFATREQPYRVFTPASLGIYTWDHNHLTFSGPSLHNFGSERYNLLYYSDIEKGQVYFQTSEVGTVLSTFPLFDQQGDYSDVGREILASLLNLNDYR